MKFEKTSEAVIAVIDSALAGYACERKKMFGATAYFVNGNMFSCAHQQDLILRLSPKDRESIQSEFDEVTPFEPIPGRIMKEYVSIPESVFSQPGMLEQWVSYSYRFATTLPQKVKKEKKKKSK